VDLIDMGDFSEQPQKMSDEELLWLVRHKVRRAIIIAVGEEGRIGATALKQKLGISTGSLYYNLRQMSQLITQDEKKTYRLTEDGLRIYRALTQTSNAQSLPKPSRAVETFHPYSSHYGFTRRFMRAELSQRFWGRCRSLS